MCVIFYFIVLFAIEMNSYSDDFEAAGCGMTVSFRVRQCCNNT